MSVGRYECVWSSAATPPDVRARPAYRPHQMVHRLLGIGWDLVNQDQSTIRVLDAEDGDAAVAVINTAAEWYRHILDPDEIHGPEMTLEEWLAEAQRMTWYGAFEGDSLIAVMGLEYVADVALFRHAYVQPHFQRQGVASLLHDHLEEQVHGVERIIVGTYTANYKARHALEKGGYRLSPDPEAILRRYYEIPEDRLRSSVTYEKPLSHDP